MSDRLTSTEGLKGGDVLMVAVQLRDKTTGDHYWWKRFVCVLAVGSRHRAMCLTLRMQVDPDKDYREVDFTHDVVTFVEEKDWPQGVVAMRMKWITLGEIKLGDLT